MLAHKSEAVQEINWLLLLSFVKRFGFSGVMIAHTGE
jgi:hypothetical protein